MTALQADFAWFCLCVWLAACSGRTTGPAELPEAQQGVWADLASTTRLRVSEVTACVGDGHLELAVAWELENIGTRAEIFNWRNKVILDRRGRRFFPARGESTPELAPGERSPRMHTAYQLPEALAQEPLAWGLYTEGNLQYRVHLHVRDVSRCVTRM